MKMQKAWPARRLILSLLVLITACQQLPIESTPAAPAISLTFMALSSNVAHYEQLAKQFTAQHPTIQVQMLDSETLDLASQTYNTPESLFRTLAANADVFLFDRMAPEVLSQGGYVHDLSSHVAQDAAFDTDDFYPDLPSRYEVDGGTWGVPAGVIPRVIYYDRTLFDAAGVAHPGPGWTWDEFLLVAQHLTRSEIEQWGFVERYGYTSAGAFLLQHGATRTSLGDPGFDDPVAAEALAWYAALSTQHRVMPGPDASDAPENGQGAIDQGRAALWVGDPRELVGSSVGVAPLPREKRDAAQESVPSYYVSARTAHAAAAWQWIAFLTHQMPERGVLPARRSLFESPAYQGALDAETAATYRYILDHLADAPWPGHVDWFDAAYRWLVGTGVPEVVRGTRDPVAVLAEAQGQAMALMQQGGASGAEPLPEVMSPTSIPDTSVPITLLTMGDEVFYEKAAQQYADQGAGVSVDVESFLGGETYPPQRRAEEADVFYVSSNFRLDEVEGHWLNLEPLIAADPDLALDDFYPQVLAAYRRQGALWALPLAVDAALLFYNQDLFDAAGIAYPHAGWTWDDFLIAAHQLTQGEGRDQQWGFAALADGWETLPLIRAAQQMARPMPLWDAPETPTAPALDTSAVVDSVRWYAALSRDESVMPLPPLYYADWVNAYDLVESGRVAMWISPAGVFGRPIEFAVGATPLPVTGSPYTSFSMTGYALSAYTPYVQESWDWLVTMTRQPGLMRALPARRSLAEAAIFPMYPQETQPALRQAFGTTLAGYADAWGVDSAPVPWHEVAYRLYRLAVRESLEHGTDPAETLGAAQTTAQAYVSCLQTHGDPGDAAVAVQCEAEVGVPPAVVWFED